MDPLTLLRELYGEEAVRKVLTSGFDSADKIAAATAESLSFFTGINEALAGQIIVSAEEALVASSVPRTQDARGGSAERAEEPEPKLPTRPRTPPARVAAASRRTEAIPVVEPSETEEIPPGLLDENPILDSGGVLRSLAREPRPKELLSEGGILEEVGLTDAEAHFLEGVSPWPSPEPPPREKTFPAFAPPPPFPERSDAGAAEEFELAPISTWSPEQDPDPVPRLVPAGGTGDTEIESAQGPQADPNEEVGFELVEEPPEPHRLPVLEPAVWRERWGTSVVVPSSTGGEAGAEDRALSSALSEGSEVSFSSHLTPRPGPETVKKPVPEERPTGLPRPSFWKFGR